jgi:hypothetical protein
VKTGKQPLFLKKKRRKKLLARLGRAGFSAGGLKEQKFCAVFLKAAAFLPQPQGCSIGPARYSLGRDL